jgi:hypothetical protein
MRHVGGVAVMYQSSGGHHVQIRGLFSAPYSLAKGQAEAGVESVGPSVFLRLTDLPMELDHDEPVIGIEGANYRVVERSPDGAGGVLLHLRLIVV